MQCFFEPFRTAHGEPISDCIVPASPVLFLPEDLTPLSTINALVRLGRSEHQHYTVLGSEETSGAPGGCNFDV